MQRNTLSFKGQNIFIGIDVHKRSWTVTTIPEFGKQRTHVQNASGKELIDFLNSYYPDGSYTAVYESGFTGMSTYYELEQYGIDCIVVNAADVPTTQYEDLMKTDPIDSVKLAKSLKSGLLRGIYIRRKDDLDDRGLVRARKAICKDLSRVRVRIKHLLMNNGVSVPERFDKPGHWPNAFTLWLRGEAKLLSTTRRSLDVLLDEADSLRKDLLKATRMIRELSRSEKYAASVELMMSIPGIGMISAMTILTEVADFSRFGNERQFASYMGLVPTSHSSGEKTVHGEKTFRGNKEIGPMIIEASWRAIHEDDTLGTTYATLAKRMTPQKAIVRIARKMSNIILAVMKGRKKYEPFSASQDDPKTGTGENTINN